MTNQNPYICRKTHIVGEIYSEIQDFFKERDQGWKGCTISEVNSVRKHNYNCMLDDGFSSK